MIQPSPRHATAPRDPTAAALALLARTCELPHRKRELITILREYRTALHALTTHADKPKPTP